MFSAETEKRVGTLRYQHFPTRFGFMILPDLSPVKAVTKGSWSP